MRGGGRPEGRSASLDDRIGSKTPTVLTWDELQPEIKAFVAMKIGGGRM